MNDLGRTNHRKPQTLVYKLDCATDNLAQGKVTLNSETLKAMSAGAAGSISPAKGTTPRLTKDEVRNTYRPAIQPAWLKHDRQVLRFFAYFQEPVVENPNENFRIRNVVITYFLEDGTMQITEPKVENSGIWPQGPFIKRHRIPKGDGSFLGPEDLKVANEVTIYSRTFRVVDADDFTKFFFQEAGMELGEPEEAPVDTFLETNVFKKESMLKKSGYPKDIMQSKEYTELKLGGSRKNHKLEQFLQNDRKVLRFYAYWDDLTRYGARQYFVMHYFLSDDTVEINNNYARNSGRHPYPVFFTRGPLELQPTMTHTPGMIKPLSPALKPSDIIVGKTIPVYGRDFFIYDADDSTKEFYANYMGHVVEPVVVPDEEKVHLQLLYPPHNGFGGDEDSLGSCLQLRPKPPRKDLVKLMTNRDRILRYEAIPENNVPEDMHRKFIIGVFLADDTVAVWEVRSRNSGCVEGKFRERGLTTNPATGKNFSPSDFFVGAEVQVSAMPFRIMRADEYTLKYMESSPAEFPQSSIGLLSLKLAPLLSQEKPAGFMSPEDFRDFVMARIGLELTDQELITVLRHACKQDTAEISISALYALMADARGEQMRMIQ
jgi:hypothetical protein